MRISLELGDVLGVSADVLISTANPWLNLSGGVNGAIREHCSEIQSELHQYLAAQGKSSVPGGSVVRTSPGTLPFSHIVHAVAIDPFYDSSVELVTKTLKAAFLLAVELKARSVAMPTLATGYGSMTTEGFAEALLQAIKSPYAIEHLTLVVRSDENLKILHNCLRHFL